MTSSRHIEQGFTEGYKAQAAGAVMLTIEQAAKQLNVSKATVKRAILHGHLRAADITERSSGAKHRPNYRIRMEWIHEYVQSRLAPPPPATQRRSPHAASCPGRDYLK